MHGMTRDTFLSLDDYARIVALAEIVSGDLAVGGVTKEEAADELYRDYDINDDDRRELLAARARF